MRYVLIHYEQNRRGHLSFACLKDVNPYFNCSAQNVFAHGIVKVGPVVREESNYCNSTLLLTSSRVTYTSIAGAPLIKADVGVFRITVLAHFLAVFQ